MPTILVAGYYGAGNLGDEAILETLLSELRARQSDLNFIVLSWNPPRTMEMFNVQSVHWQDMSAIVDSAAHSDLIIVGGGGIFHDQWGIDSQTYLRIKAFDITAFGSLPLLAELLDVPCMIYGVGVGPLNSETAIEHTRLAFNRAHTITVRDEDSLSLLIEKDILDSKERVKVFPDPVFTLHSKLEDEREADAVLDHFHISSQTPILFISLRYHDIPGPPWEWLPFIADGVNRFLARNRDVSVLLVPFQVQDATPFTNDALILKKLYEYVNESHRFYLIEHEISPRMAQALIKRSAVVLTMRFHALVLGVNEGVPLVALSTNPKLEALMKALNLMDFCNTTLTPSPEILASQLQQAYENRFAIQMRFKDIYANWREGAGNHAVYALKLLAKSQRHDLSPSQLFLLEQTKQLETADRHIDFLNAEIKRLHEQNMQIPFLQKQLEDIQSSLFLKLARRYYSVSQTLREKVWNLVRAVKNIFQREGRSFFITQEQELKVLLESLQRGGYKGLFIIVSSDFVHINSLLQNLTQEKYAVLKIASNSTTPDVGNGIWLDESLYLQAVDALGSLLFAHKYLLQCGASREAFPTMLQLDRRGFHTAYEICAVSDSLRDIQSAFIHNADIVLAQNLELQAEYSNLRNDIQFVNRWEITASHFINTIKSGTWIF